MNYITLFVFSISTHAFITAPLKILQSSKESIIRKLKIVENEYIHFIDFIHEFHHVVGSQTLSNNYKNIDNTYMIAQNKIFPQLFTITPATYNIKFNKENYYQYQYNDGTKLIILKLEMLLSGYAAEEAFKRKSILLRYFIKDHSFVDTKSIFTLLINNIQFKKIINDINFLFIYKKEIDYNNPIIKNYIDRYNNQNINKKNMSLVEKLYPEIPQNFFKILYIIYEDLIIKYSQNSHQEKFYSMIRKNPYLLHNEIFFFKDLKSLWENHELYRNIGNLKNYNDTEIKIIKALINKKIHSFEKIEQLKKTNMHIFKINIISEKIYYYQKLITKKIQELYSCFN